MDANAKDLRLTDEEKLEVFGAEFAGKLDAHEAEAAERWGGTDPYAESRRRTSEYSKAEWVQIKAEGDATIDGLAEAKRSGAPSDADVAMDAAEVARLNIDRWFYPCSHEMHVGLGDMYVTDARFTKTYDDVEPGLAEFVRDAILANSLRNA